MNQYKDENFIKDYGFKRKYLSDKSGWWLQYKSKNTILRNCIIMIHGDRIFVEIDIDDNRKYNLKTSVSIVKRKLNNENFLKVLYMFQ